MYNSTYGEVLQDTKNGKRKPWKEKKMKSLTLAASLKRLGYTGRAKRVEDCGNILEFLRDLATGLLRLQKTYFCKVPLCPMCMWRKSLKISYQVSRVMDITFSRYPDLLPLFLTLTLKNCTPDDLKATLDVLLSGWREFERGRKVKLLVKAYFRSVEITYDKDEIISKTRYNRAKKYYDRLGIKPGDKNPNFDTFHPHIHAIILVDKSYFDNGYLETWEWLTIWKQAAKLNYDPIGDIRSCRPEGKQRKEIAEVAKYTLKDTEFLDKQDEPKMDRLVGILSEALFRRRLFEFGGVMRDIAKEIDAEKPDEGDLVHINDQTIRADMATQVERYRWRFGINNYVRF